MVNTIRKVFPDYGVRTSVIVNVVAGVVCGGTVAIILGVNPLVVLAVVSGLVLLIA